MGLFSKKKVEKRSTEDFYASSALGDLFTSSASVTRTQAMSISAFYSGIDLLSNSIATLDRSVHTITSGIWTPDISNPINQLVNNRPSQYINNFDFYKMVVQDLYLHGNAFVQIIRDKTFNPIELIHHPALNVEVLTDINRQFKQFRINNTGQFVEYDDMVHVMLHTDDGIMGKSLISFAGQSLKLGENAQTFASNYFEKGTNISGILSSEQKLGAEGQTKLRNAWNAAYKGNSNSFNVAVLEGNLKFERLSVDPKASQLLETRQYTTAEISRWLNIPMFLLDGSAVANIELANAQFLQRTILPLDERILSEFNLKIFKPSERYKKKIHTDYSSLLKASLSTRTTYYKELYNIGVLSQNDIRKAEHMPPIAGGNDYYIMGNNMDKIGEADEEKTDTEN